MNAKRKILFRVGAVALLLLIAAAMFIVGRGHTVYLDNVSMDYNGQTYTAPYKVVAYVNGEEAARLYEKERGMAISIGQNFTMSLEITETKGGAEETSTITVRLPRNMDGIILNLPTLLAGLPEEAYLTQFIPTYVEPQPEDEEIVTDEFVLPEDEGDTD